MNFLGLLLGAGVLRNATDYPAEIRNLKSQMPKSERAQFLDNYKHLPKEKKAEFKAFLQDANLKAAGEVIGRDLTQYKVPPAKTAAAEVGSNAIEAPDSGMDAQLQANAAFNKRIHDILAVPIPGLDPELVAEAAKRYENIASTQVQPMLKADKSIDISH